MSAEYRVVWQRESWQGPDASPPAPRRSQHYASLDAAQRWARRLKSGRISLRMLRIESREVGAWSAVESVQGVSGDHA